MSRRRNGPRARERRHRADRGSPFDTSERGAGYAPARDQEPRDDVEGLTFACDSDHGREAPSFTGGLDRLAHHVDAARRLEREIGAEAAGLGPDPLDRVVTGNSRLRRAVSLRFRQALSSARSIPMIRWAPARRHPITAPRPTRPQPNTTHVEPDSTRAVKRAAPIPVERPHANGAHPSSGASGLTFASAISGTTVYSAKVEVPMKCLTASPFRAKRVVPSGKKPRP